MKRLCPRARQLVWSSTCGPWALIEANSCDYRDSKLCVSSEDPILKQTRFRIDREVSNPRAET